MAEKQRQRVEDEGSQAPRAVPLKSSKNAPEFFGFDPSYHFARYHFCRKTPKARTPSYLAAPITISPWGRIFKGLGAPGDARPVGPNYDEIRHWEWPFERPGQILRDPLFDHSQGKSTRSACRNTSTKGIQGNGQGGSYDALKSSGQFLPAMRPGVARPGSSWPLSLKAPGNPSCLLSRFRCHESASNDELLPSFLPLDWRDKAKFNILNT